MQLIKIPHVFWTGFLLVVLCSCQSTNIEAPTTNLDLNSVEFKQDTIYTFNTRLEEALNAADSDFFASQISRSAISEKLTEKAPDIFFSPQQIDATALKFKNKVLESVSVIPSVISWEYLYSETFSLAEVASYYRQETEEGYNYFIFWVNPNTFQIFDFHPVTFELSGLDFLVKFSSLMIENSKGDNKQLVRKLIAAVQAQDIEQIIPIYREAKDSLVSEPVLDDFVLRSIGQFASSENYETLIENIIADFEKQSKSSLMFESYYYQQGNFSKAINAVKAVKKFALNDSKMQSELSILHSLNNNHSLAIEHGSAAIIANPQDEEAYFSLLQVALYAEDHQLATEIIDVLVAKFDYIIDKDVIVELDNHQAFLESDTFAAWAQKHMQI
ncbi:tetratricopeptide repeat protein [Paraglaciecola sp. 2405UD69-4]|uniref:tetratricopeptide repeat protein n=1 Tax=Paraglaciecola sp. 2405UD69-4 TaxID=3391836 RepID=UPI0039C91B9C